MNAAGAATGSAYQTAIQHVVDYYNSHGGLNGCSIKGVYFPFTILTGNYTTESQQECALDTQDNHVVAVIPLAWEQQTFIDCMARAHVPVVWGVNISTFLDQRLVNRHPGIVYMPWAISGERMAAFIKYFQKAGYFNPGTKLGVLLPADGTYGSSSALWNDYWKPELAALHIDVVSTFTYPPEAGTGSSAISELQDSSEQSNAAVLRFKSAGVNHVLIVPGGASAFSFTAAAKSQDYHPRFATVSSDYPALGTGSELNDAMAVGWIESLDGVPNTDIVENPARALCDSLFKGQAQIANGGDYFLCDGLSLLQEGWKGAPKLNVASLQTGVGRLGKTFTSAATFRTVSLSSQRFDGVYRVRMESYSSKTGTWSYFGPYLNVP